MYTPTRKNVYYCFPGGRYKCLTMSYDDGRREDLRLVPLFNQYGIKATFNLNSERQDDPRRLPVSMYPELYKGHEVAAHTCTHPTICRSPLSQVVEQVMEDRRALERLMGYPVRGLAYPNGSCSEEIARLLPALGIRYARTIEETQSFAVPDDFLLWKATCHHNHNLLELADRFLAEDKPQYWNLMYVWGHSFEFTVNDNWELIETFCRKVGGREDIWYATNIEVVDYVTAAKMLEFTVDADVVYNPSSLTLWISVNGKIYELPGGSLTRLE